MKLSVFAAAAVMASAAAQAEPPSRQRFSAGSFAGSCRWRRLAAISPISSGAAPRHRTSASETAAGPPGSKNGAIGTAARTLAPEEMSGEALAGRTAACLPEAEAGKTGLGRDWVFTLPHAKIHISEIGGPRAKVGRIVTFSVEATPAP